MGESSAPVTAPIALGLILAGVGCAVIAGFGDPYSSSADAAADAVADAARDASSGDVSSTPVEAASDAGSAYPAAVLADTPLLYYRLEEPAGAGQVASEVAGSNVARVMATPTLGVPGKVGDAIAFDGVTDGYLEVDGDATQFLGVAPFTLEAWVFPRASDGTYRHVFIRDTNDQAGGRNEYGVWIQNSKIGFERYCNGTAVKAVSAVVPLNTWFHVVAVYDGATVSLWLNGQSVAQQPDTRPTNAKDKLLRFGSRDPNGGRFDGTIDEIAVYDHALASDRIAAHFQGAQ